MCDFGFLDKSQIVLATEYIQKTAGFLIGSHLLPAFALICRMQYKIVDFFLFNDIIIS